MKSNWWNTKYSAKELAAIYTERHLRIYGSKPDTAGMGRCSLARAIEEMDEQVTTVAA